MSAVAGLRERWDATDLKAAGVAKLSLLAHPNMLVDLAEPVRSQRGREVTAIAHRLDDPTAFSAAFASLRRGHGQ